MQLLNEEQYKEAQQLVKQDWLGRIHQNYLPLGDLFIALPHAGKAAGYRRWLNLATAVSHVQYTMNGITFEREILTSDPDVWLSAKGPDKIYAVICQP